MHSLILSFLIICFSIEQNRNSSNTDAIAIDEIKIVDTELDQNIYNHTESKDLKFNEDNSNKIENSYS